MLPRWLRKPVRTLSRLGRGDFAPPRFAATMATAALFAATGLYGTYVAGDMPALAQAVTARTGFAVDKVRVFGHRETSEIDVLDKLELDGWTSLIGFDADDARERIASLPWVESASVRKVYPDVLEIRLQERKPFAIWQHESELSIIGAKGNIIAPFTGARHSDLPLVVGPGAGEQAAGFVASVAAFPQIASRVKGYIQVADRRWDLRLDNGMTIRLPETGVARALADVVAMDREQQLLSRDVMTIDMRLSDRVVVQLSPEAASARKDAMDAQDKARRKAGKKNA